MSCSILKPKHPNSKWKLDLLIPPTDFPTAYYLSVNSRGLIQEYTYLSLQTLSAAVTVYK